MYSRFVLLKFKYSYDLVMRFYCAQISISDWVVFDSVWFALKQFCTFELRIVDWVLFSISFVLIYIFKE
jgi:hypothetical protein